MGCTKHKCNKLFSQNSAARGKAEKAVGTVKLMLKKILATASSESLNWEMLPFLVSKAKYTTIP